MKRKKNTENLKIAVNLMNHRQSFIPSCSNTAPLFPLCWTHTLDLSHEQALNLSTQFAFHSFHYRFNTNAAFSVLTPSNSFSNKEYSVHFHVSTVLTFLLKHFFRFIPIFMKFTNVTYFQKIQGIHILF